MEKPTINFMLDIETLDVKPNAHILEIALVKFDIITGVVDESASIHHTFGLKNQGGNIDADTLYWWLHQGKNVDKQRDYLIYLTRPTIEMDLEKSLIKIDAILNLSRSMGKVRVWSASMFDSDVLNAAFSRIYNKIEKPLIPFYETRDCRALRDIGDMYPNLIRINSLPEATHNAYEDCIRQIGYVTEVTQYIESVKKSGRQ